jgi:hypothetical protein
VIRLVLLLLLISIIHSEYYKIILQRAAQKAVVRGLEAAKKLTTLRMDNKIYI